MSQGFLVLICKNLWHMIPFIWGKVKGSARWSWWQMQFIRVTIRLDRKKLQFGISWNSVKLWRIDDTGRFKFLSVKSFNHMRLEFPETILASGSATMDKTRRHNRNIYAQSRMSASTPHTQMYWSLIFEWTQVYTHWVCDWFLFWWLHAHTSLLHVLLAW